MHGENVSSAVPAYQAAVGALAESAGSPITVVAPLRHSPRLAVEADIARSAVRRSTLNPLAAAFPTRSLIVSLASFLAGAAVLAGLLIPGWAPVILIGFALACGAMITFTTLLGDRADPSRDAPCAPIEQRTRTLDRLLEFSQTIQGAGKPEQVFAALGHYLQTELTLAGLVILTNEPESVPTVQVKTSWPADVLLAHRPVAEMEQSTCPCLRQHLPREFKADGCPVRCAIDSSLALDATHPAFCVPFTVGRRTQVLVHMLMSPKQIWTDDQKQLAQTYCNTAQSALVSLNLLAEAEQQSMTDALTGLYNRRSMEQLLSREVALTERHGHALSVVMIDMDKFKEINDAHGHAAGDYLLKSFADCVRMTLRKTDLAFRFGGDEFVIALPQTSIVQAQQVVQKLRQAFGSIDFSDAIANLEHRPTLSIGVAERSKATGVLTLPALLQAADAALYDAKSANRNCVRVYEPQRAA
jgi:diguanylate cyclase (GGDEF)-like protein